jgi:hypothetical protein
MSTIAFEQGAFSVDADIVAAGLVIEPAFVQPLMRDGQITSVCERGTGEDAGRYRLTFFHGNRAFHLVVDEEGQIIERSTHDIEARRGPSPGPRRKPGA